MRRIAMLVLLICAVGILPAFAAEPVRIFVGDITVVGAQSKEETRAALQALLASRISGARILSVGSAAEAEVTVNGTYLALGKQYSLDAVAKNVGGQTVARSFVQGEGGQEALFAAVGTLADKLSVEVLKQVDAGTVPRVARVIAAPPQQGPARAPGSNDIIRSGAVLQSGDLQRMPQGDIIRPQAFYRGAPNRGEIKRLEGVVNLLALGGTDADGKRLIFMAQDRSVQLYREGEGRPITGLALSVVEKIVGLDYVDADGNGTPELYLSVVKQNEVSSQVWELKNNKLVKVADNIPYFFRSIALAGGPVKLYAQEQGRGEEQYYGDVFEVVRNGKKIVKKKKIPMPRFGNLYSFNQFKQENGELLTVVYHEHNYLIVYDKQLKELWRSNDAFGGSELFYQIEDLDRFRVHGDKYRWFFMNQRILVTSKNEILVGKNDGFWVLGNARMYKRGAVYSLYWNGAALEEIWRTKDTQNYMPDFYYDEPKSELLLLQLTQREDVVMRLKGASALQIKKVE